VAQPTGRLAPPASSGILHVAETGAVVVSLGYFQNSDRFGLEQLREPEAPGPFQLADDQVAASAAAAADSTVPLRADDLGLVPGREYMVLVGYRAVDSGGITGATIALVRGGSLGVAESDPAFMPLDLALGAGYGLRDVDANHNYVLVVDDVDETISFRAYHTGGAGAIYLDCAYFIPALSGNDRFFAESQFEPDPNPRPTENRPVVDALRAFPIAAGAGYGLQLNGLCQEDSQVTDRPAVTFHLGAYPAPTSAYELGEIRRVLVFARCTQRGAQGRLRLRRDGVLQPSTPVQGSSYQLVDLGDYIVGECLAIDAWTPTGGAGNAIRVEAIHLLYEGTPPPPLDYTGSGIAVDAADQDPTLFQVALGSYFAPWQS